MPLFNRDFANLLGCLVFLLPFPAVGGEGARCFCLGRRGCCQMNGVGGSSVRMTALSYGHAAPSPGSLPNSAASDVFLGTGINLVTY